jgi:hypothetical protein
MDNEHGERLARIEVNTEMLLRRFDALDVRVSAVEKKQWIHTGALVVLAPLLAKFGVHLPS